MFLLEIIATRKKCLANCNNPCIVQFVDFKYVIIIVTTTSSLSTCDRSVVLLRILILDSYLHPQRSRRSINLLYHISVFAKVHTFSQLILNFG